MKNLTGIRTQEKMNVGMLKNLLRNQREDLCIRLYDEETSDELVKGTLEELMKVRDYDSCEICGMVGQFEFKETMVTADDVLNGYRLNVGIFLNKSCKAGAISVDELSSLYEECVQYDRMHKRFSNAIRMIEMYDFAERMSIRKRINEYMALPADELEINFDEDEMLEIIEEYESCYEEADEYYDLMGVTIKPILPDGMILFY